MVNSSPIAGGLTWEDARHARQRFWTKVSCALFGHKVSNVAFSVMRNQAKRCPWKR